MPTLGTLIGEVAKGASQELGKLLLAPERPRVGGQGRVANVDDAAGPELLVDDVEQTLSPYVETHEHLEGFLRYRREARFADIAALGGAYISYVPAGAPRAAVAVAVSSAQNRAEHFRAAATTAERGIRELSQVEGAEQRYVGTLVGLYSNWAVAESHQLNRDEAVRLLSEVRRLNSASIQYYFNNLCFAVRFNDRPWVLSAVAELIERFDCAEDPDSWLGRIIRSDGALKAFRESIDYSTLFPAHQQRRIARVWLRAVGILSNPKVRLGIAVAIVLLCLWARLASADMGSS